MPVCAALLFVTGAGAATTATWEMSNYQDFMHGRLSGVSLTRDGRLMLAPRVDAIFSSGQPEIWSVAAAADGALYLGTGHRGRVYRIDSSGNGSVYWTSDRPEVFAVALDPKGGLYAATSPDGRIYRIENGKASEYFAPKEKYIWALAVAPDGSLFAGTGDRGRIYRISGAGKGEVYYETGQSHITCLAFDARGHLLAGSEPNGILYRVSAKGKAFALYDANLPEIRTILPQPDGSIYAAALGGSIAHRANSAVAATISTPITVTSSSNSVTVTDSATQSGAEIKPKAEPPKQPAVTPSPAPAVTTVEYSGVEKSAVYKIHPDNTVETLWTSKEENIYDLIATGNQLVFATDSRGRIYRLNSERKATLVAETGQGETTRLLAWRGSLLAATGDTGVLYRLGRQAGIKGTYESPVHDTGTVARWGRLSWKGETAPNTRLAFETRTGNSARPDATWSDWSEPLSNPAESLVRSPNARYIQWRAEFSGPGGVTPSLDGVTIAYLPQNNPPVVRSVMAMSLPAPSSSGQKTASTSPTASYSITVTDSGDTSSSGSTGTQAQTLTRSFAQQTQVTWQADDPDGDKLIYSLYFRGEGERAWKLLKANLYDNTFSIDADALADGRYTFRVVASDSPANPPNFSREAEAVSAPVLIDNTPPSVTLGSPRHAGAALEIDINVADRASALRRCEYSMDARPWIPIEAADGVTDAPHERYVLRIGPMPPGEHLIVVRAYDSAGNAGLAKVVVH